MIGRKGLLFNGQRAFSIHKGLSKISLEKGRQPVQNTVKVPKFKESSGWQRKAFGRLRQDLITYL